MSKVLSLAFAACLLFAGAMNQTATAADLKIGVMNGQAIALESDAFKALQKKAVAKIDPEGKQVEKQAKDLQKKEKDLQGKLSTMSAKAREEAQADFLKQARSFEEKRRDLARKMQAEENTIFQGVGQLIEQATRIIANKKQLDLVINAASGGVAFAKPELDINEEVLAEVNRLWKANGNKIPAAPAASSKKR